MTGMAFSAGALDANRAGRLGPDQLHDLQASVRYRRRGLVRHLLHSGDAFAQDVASGQVASVEGAITKKILQSSYGGEGEAPPSYRIWVASRQSGNEQFKSGAEFYDSAPDGGFVRLFYLPKSKWAVNFEWLPDAPPQDRPSGRLCAAITGDWQSPFLSISVRAGTGHGGERAVGAAQAGRWSVDPAGRVVTDVMGAWMAIDASVAGDVLTLIINGRALNLRRSPT